MRIAIDALNIRAGGGLTHLREFLAAAPLVEFGAAITVLAQESTATRLLEIDRISIVKPPGRVVRSTLGLLLWRRLNLDAWVNEVGADVLLVPGGTYQGRFAPFVAMAQNLLPFSPRERHREGWRGDWLRLHLLEYLQARTFRRANRVIHMSEQARVIIDRRVGLDSARTTVVYHGVNSRFVGRGHSARNPEGLVRTGPFRWLYLSVIEAYKHQPAVAQAAGILLGEGFDLALDFVGPGLSHRIRELEQAISRVDPAGQRIRYRGAANYDAIENYYAAADGFVLASSCETFGMIAVEAMAAGLPMAVSDRPALPEIVGDAGVYFDPEDPASIAGAMRRIMTDTQLRRDLGRLARNRAAAFSWDKCARATLECLASAHREHRAIAGSPEVQSAAGPA